MTDITEDIEIEDIEIEDIDDESYYLQELRMLEKKLEIATKALKQYAEEGNWDDCRSYNFYIDDMALVEKAQFGEKGYEPAQKALKEITLAGTSTKEE